jgi:hypothetical protein
VASGHACDRFQALVTEIATALDDNSVRAYVPVSLEHQVMLLA